MAVYTHLSNEEIAALLTQYDVGALQFAVGIAQGVENSNYLLVANKGGAETKYILTLYEKRVDANDLPFYLGLMQHLAQREVPCPLPIVRRDGALVGEVGRRPQAMVSFVEGQSRTQIKPPYLAELGKALAQMHVAADGFALTRKNALSLDGWQKIFAKIQSRLDEVEQGLSALVAAELAFLQAHWPTDLPSGIIHADLFPDNVFFEGERLSGVIDFYFACRDILAYDIAVCLNSWCFEGKSAELNITKVKLLLQGYEQQRPLTPAEREAFVLLNRGAALRFLLTRAHDWIFREEGALVTPKDPKEYLRKLKFHQQVRSLAEYGVIS